MRGVMDVVDRNHYVLTTIDLVISWKHISSLCSPYQHLYEFKRTSIKIQLCQDSNEKQFQQSKKLNVQKMKAWDLQEDAGRGA